MPRSYNFGIIRVVPDVRRGESVNVGIVVLGESGPDVRLLPNMGKVQALDGAFDAEALHQLPEIFRKWTYDQWVEEGSFETFGEFGPISIAGGGEFSARDEDDYGATIDDLMAQLVRPPKAPKKPSRSRLRTKLKTIFESRSLLGATTEDVWRGLVVPHYPISENLELYADFAFKNGSWNFISTIDFGAGQHAQKHREACAIAFTLETANEEIQGGKEKFVVFSNGQHSRDDITPHLSILKKGADHLIDIRDSSEIEDLVSEATNVKASLETDSLLDQ
ncbi:MAG: DUF3037 domain-containing protein [Rhodovibrionaceae bacterium]